MDWNKWIRDIHRWVAVAFTLTVVLVTVVAAGWEEPAEWVFFLPLLPLAGLFFSGVYLFVLPYARRRRGLRTG